MAKYVDGFVFVVPKKNLLAYKKMAKEASEVWKKYGALEYMECRGNDLNTKSPDGKPVSNTFIKLTKAKPSETVWFSFITYKSKKDRDRVNKQVMDYFSNKYADQKDESMPFDMERMVTGGFEVVVE